MRANILIETNQYILQQLIDLLQQLSEQTYQQPLEVFEGNSIGQHVRHVTEFYTCLLQGLPQQRVNYDKRARNYLIEQQPAVAMEILQMALLDLSAVRADTPLTLETAFGQEALVEVPSSFLRELIYLIEHAIHHMALIRIGLHGLPVVIAPDFGVAPSTVHYRQSLSEA
jgi:uncharacterized damage-inducible protein DinB